MSTPIPPEVIEQVRQRAADEAEATVREALESATEGDLRDIEQRVRDRVLKLGGSLLEQALRLAGTGYEGAGRACRCGGRQKFVGHRTKQMMTLLSQVALARAYYHCRRCHRGQVPLDQRWDVVRTGFSPAFREAVAWLGAELPFRLGAEYLHRLCRVTISPQRVEQITQGFGEQLEDFREQEIPSGPAGAASAAAHDLYTELDGTTIPLREGWREVKVAAIFRTRSGAEEDPLRGATTYLARITDAEQFGDLVWNTLERLHPERAARQVRIGDGAPWIWGLAQLQAPSATQIVDWYHATEHLGQIGKGVFGEHSPRATPWIEAREAELWNGQVEDVLSALTALKPRSHSGREMVRLNRDYFSTHCERMRYDRFRTQKLFIGSGVVEGGGCKHVVGDRFKRAGMRWSPDGARRTLNLRVCLINQEWDIFHRWRSSRLREAA